MTTLISPESGGDYFGIRTSIRSIRRAKRRAVIERILERGNEEEKDEIRRFYGEAVVQEIAKNHRPFWDIVRPL